MMKFARAALAASLLAVATDSLAQWAGCPDKPDPSQKATAIDTGYGFDASNPEAIRFLEAAKATGIKTIIRYYDWAHRPGQEPESFGARQMGAKRVAVSKNLHFEALRRRANP